MNDLEDLPKGWVWTKIGSITVYGPQNGLYLPLSVYGTGIPILRIDDFQDGISRSSSELRLVNAQKEDIERYSLREGDLVINRVNSPSHLGKCLLVWDRNLPALYESNMMRLRLSEKIDAKFVAFYLRSSVGRSRLISNAKWAVNQASINQNDVNNTPLPLPPLIEQRRIVVAIEQHISRLDAGVAALRQAQTKLKRYRTALLKAAVEGKLTEAWRAEHPATETASMLLERILAERKAKWEADLRAKGKDPARVRYVEPAKPYVEGLPELPEGWCWATLEQLITYLRNGLPQKPDTVPPGYRILRINAVRPMHVDLNEVRYLQLPEKEVANYFLDAGDILFTRYNGSLELLGVAGMVRNCSEPTLHPDKLIRARTVLSGSLPYYIELASNVGISRAFLESRARTTAGQTGISGSDLKQIPLPLPPLTEQEQIVAEVEQRLSVVSELEAIIEANLKRAVRLRQSILREAFAGLLVPQDPNDEPASVLLERIRKEREERKMGNRGNGRFVSATEPVKIDVDGVQQVELWE